MVNKYRAVYENDWRTLRRGRFQRAIREGVLAQSWEMQPNEEVLPAALRDGGTSDDFITARNTGRNLLRVRTVTRPLLNPFRLSLFPQHPDLK